MPTISTTVDVDVGLCNFTTDELLGELSSRGESTTKDITDFEVSELIDEIKHQGYFVSTRPNSLTLNELQYLLSLFPSDCKTGSERYFTQEKLIRMMQYAEI